MSNSKISALTSATTPLAGTETLPIVQSSTTKQVSVANLTAGRSVSTGALSVVGANATLDNAYYLNGKLAAGSAVAMIGRNSSDVVVIDPDGYGAKIGFGGRYSFAGGGDFTNVLGNYIPATAAKGINFTANTPTAGMTSQLLNWYEEGTWTPSPTGITIVSGTPVYSGYYTKVGRLVTVNWYMSGGNITTVAGTSRFTNLPFANAAGYSHGIFQNELTYAFGPMESGPSTNLYLNANITGAYMAGTITYMAT